MYYPQSPVVPSSVVQIYFQILVGAAANWKAFSTPVMEDK